jgi:hypothetical protein
LEGYIAIARPSREDPDSPIITKADLTHEVAPEDRPSEATPPKLLVIAVRSAICTDPDITIGGIGVDPINLEVWEVFSADPAGILSATITNHPVLKRDVERIICSIHINIDSGSPRDDWVTTTTALWGFIKTD